MVQHSHFMLLEDPIACHGWWYVHVYGSQYTFYESASSSGIFSECTFYDDIYYRFYLEKSLLTNEQNNSIYHRLNHASLVQTPFIHFTIKSYNEQDYIVLRDEFFKPENIVLPDVFPTSNITHTNNFNVYECEQYACICQFMEWLHITYEQLKTLLLGKKFEDMYVWYRHLQTLSVESRMFFLLTGRPYFDGHETFHEEDVLL